MKLKPYLLFRASLYAALTLFLLSTPLWLDIGGNEWGYPIAFLMASVFAYLTLNYYKKSKIARDEDRAYAPPTDSTIKQQIKFYKRYMIIGLVGSILLTIITAIDLNSLENNSAENVLVLAPIAFLYENYGYWTAILAIPLFSIVITALFVRKISSIKSANITT